MDLPREDALRWIARSYARVRARCGDALAAPPLVQPTGAFFPDEFRFDAPSVERLLRRMIGHSPVADDLGVELAFVDTGEGRGGGCGSAACGDGAPRASIPPVQELDDGYRVLVAAGDVGSAEVLTTSLARSVGALVLHEADANTDVRTPDRREGADANTDVRTPDRREGADANTEVASDEAEIAAVACGFGVLVANGAAVWAKSCGGLRMTRATVLPVEEVAVSLALFAGVHATKASAVRAHLGATQRESFDLAEAWVASNPLLVEALRDRPSSLEGGAFDLEPIRGAFGRWLYKRRLDRELAAPPPSRAAPISEDRRRRLEEARALVDEVFDVDVRVRSLPSVGRADVTPEASRREIRSSPSLPARKEPA
jgi:hypothetical protein